jgi:putative transposase
MTHFKPIHEKGKNDMKTNTQNAPMRDMFPEHLQIPAEPGLYFFTICMGQGSPRLGKISGGSMKPNATGRAVEAHWQNLSRIFDNVRLETFALMPDHVHGIIAIEDGAPHGLAAILRTFKSVSARDINKRRQTPGHAMWQWGHEEHALHDAAALEKMQDHILAAPVRWQLDRKNTLRLKLRRRSGRIIRRILNRPLPAPAFPQKIHAALRRT